MFFSHCGTETDIDVNYLIDRMAPGFSKAHGTWMQRYEFQFPAPQRQTVFYKWELSKALGHSLIFAKSAPRTTKCTVHCWIHCHLDSLWADKVCSSSGTKAAKSKKLLKRPSTGRITAQSLNVSPSPVCADECHFLKTRGGEGKWCHWCQSRSIVHDRLLRFFKKLFHRRCDIIAYIPSPPASRVLLIFAFTSACTSVLPVTSVWLAAPWRRKPSSASIVAGGKISVPCCCRLRIHAGGGHSTGETSFCSMIQTRLSIYIPLSFNGCSKRIQTWIKTMVRSAERHLWNRRLSQALWTLWT